MPYELLDHEYTSLRSMVLGAHPRGSPTWEAAHALFRGIEDRAGRPRFTAWVRWNAVDSPVPTERFPESWPVSQQKVVEVEGRPLNRADILAVVGGGNPALVMVTRDPRGVVGWQDIDIAFPP